MPIDRPAGLRDSRSSRPAGEPETNPTTTRLIKRRGHAERRLQPSPDATRSIPRGGRSDSHSGIGSHSPSYRRQSHGRSVFYPSPTIRRGTRVHDAGNRSHLVPGVQPPAAGAAGLARPASPVPRVQGDVPGTRSRWRWPHGTRTDLAPHVSRGPPTKRLDAMLLLARVRAALLRRRWGHREWDADVPLPRRPGRSEQYGQEPDRGLRAIVVSARTTRPRNASGSTHERAAKMARPCGGCCRPCRWRERGWCFWAGCRSRSAGTTGSHRSGVSRQRSTFRTCAACRAAVAGLWGLLMLNSDEGRAHFGTVAARYMTDCPHTH